MVLEFYPVLPADCVAPPKEGFGQETSGKSRLCQRTVIGGVRVDDQGGPWLGCQAVAGAHDARVAGGAGYEALRDTGLSGVRVFVGIPGAGIPVGEGQMITSVDQCNADNQRLSNDTYWP
ncbi:hypothetical protein KV205_34990 [Streptomyces sp. SKN60]|uniref:hypothetical protein n=1 Tax=Streptomyces sp. SKN60 TaxID=2855506 RepID=UPI002245BC0C|nr:hypothetical protein [Streptomyces sp. SKN60]MCX2185681.1 hypothetical protein [Streptomyces sp. SKN60]